MGYSAGAMLNCRNKYLAVLEGSGFALLLACTISSVSAQAKSQLGESFAQAGLKAVVIIKNEPGSDRAKAAYDDVEVELDRMNPYELTMLANLTSFRIVRSDGPLPSSCSIALEDAFRQRISIDLPKSCSHSSSQ